MIKSARIELHVIGVAALLGVLENAPKRRQRGHYLATIDNPRSILSRLFFQLSRRPGIHLWDDLVDSIWGCCEDGGPLNAVKILHINAFFLRKLQYRIITYPKLGLQLVDHYQERGVVRGVGRNVEVDE
jgi:hypothetical protein